jgi:hypothetical protein
MPAYFVQPNASPQAAWGTPAAKSILEDLAKLLQAIREIDLAALAHEQREKIIALLRELRATVMKLLNEFLSLQMELEATQVSSALSSFAK